MKHRIRNWFRCWIGLDDLTHEINYLRGLIEGDYCIILDTEGARIENCHIENFETAILIRGKNSTVTGCFFRGKHREEEP